jgi:hypothetical protein
LVHVSAPHSPMGNPDIPLPEIPLAVNVTSFIKAMVIKTKFTDSSTISTIYFLEFKFNIIRQIPWH